MFLFIPSWEDRLGFGREGAGAWTAAVGVVAGPFEWERMRLDQRHSSLSDAYEMVVGSNFGMTFTDQTVSFPGKRIRVSGSVGRLPQI